MMRFGRYAIALVVALALVASTPSVVAAPPPDLEGARAAAEASKPLPRNAVTPVTDRGRWFSISQRTVRNGPGAKASKGRQSLIKITGPRARQRFAFDVALPSGSRLEMRGARVAAIDEQGSITGVLEVPWAVDALGIKVTTRFEVVDRDTFVQVVEHRPVGATYPVYADPWFVVAIVVREGARQLGRYVVRRATYEAAKRAAARMAARESGFEIDELLARTPVKLLTLNARNFRENVRRRTGWAKASTKGYDAHHTLPKKFEGDFKQAGLNIHNPIFGHWWCASAHRSAARAFNRAWERWLDDRDIENSKYWRNEIEYKRIEMVSNPDWARTYQCA